MAEAMRGGELAWSTLYSTSLSKIKKRDVFTLEKTESRGVKENILLMGGVGRSDGKW